MSSIENIEQAFGSEIGNIMTASQTADLSNEGLLVKKLENDTETDISADTSMEKSAENGSSKPGSLMSKVLAIEVYSLINHYSSNEEDLLDDLEDLLDEGFFVGEHVYHSGTEHEVKSKEKRGGMTLYTMTDGSKIGNRELKRKKGVNKDYLKKCLEKDANFDGKVWKVTEEVTNNYQLKPKLAPIFNMTPKSAKKEKEESSDDDESEEPKVVFQGRASAGGQPSKKGMLNQQKKLEKEKEKAEKKKIQEEEKRKKIEEKKKEKDAKLAEKKKEKEKEKEKVPKKESKNGKLDAFLKKSEDGFSPSKSAPIFSQQKALQRLNNGIKKLEEAWNKRDQEAFSEACQWCEKQLSGVQIGKIENSLWKYSVQKLVDKTKDQNQLKKLKGEPRAQYRQNVMDKRKELYKSMDPKIRLHFTEEWSQDDLIIASTTSGKVTSLDLPANRIPLELGEYTMEAMEITQFFVALANVIGFNHDVSISRLESAIRSGPEGYKDCLYHMYESVITSFLMDSEYSKLAHANVRLADFKCTENSITEMYRAFFIGEYELSPKIKKSGNATETEKALETTEHEEKMEVDTNESLQSRLFTEEERQKALSWFNSGVQLQDLSASQHIELLQICVRILLQLEIVREWHQREVITEDLTKCRNKLREVTDQLEELSRELAELPPPTENAVEMMSRASARDAATVEKKRERLERQTEEVRDEVEKWQIKMANEKINIQRSLRTFYIGEDRHFRRYYRMDFNSDAGIWIQDFGTTSYEKWAMECWKLGFKNFDIENPEKLPEHVQERFSQEKWYKVVDEESLKNLESSLFEKGIRERMIKNYLKKNMEDIKVSISKYSDEQRSESRSTSPEATQNNEEDQEDDDEDEEEAEEQKIEKIEFAGAFSTIKTAIQNLCQDLEESEILMSGKTEEFDKKMESANSLDQMKEILVEFVQGVNSKFVVERIPMKEALITKKFSVLFIPRFSDRIREAVSSSALHLYLDFFDSRIDRKRTIKNQSCRYCKRKTGNALKLMCQHCSVVIHSRCVRPRIANYMLEDAEFRANWMCNPCSREQAARLKRAAEEAAKEEEEDGSEAGSDEEEEEHEEEEEEEEENENGRRKRKAKQMASEAIREAAADPNAPWRMTRAGSAPRQQAPPPKKKPVEPEVREFFESIEMANPRLYKSLLKVDINNGYGKRDVMHLSEIEKNLSTYGPKTMKKLRTDVINFLNVARDEFEDAGNRKLDELDELISKFDV